jgi:hypothetical protein
MGPPATPLQTVTAAGLCRTPANHCPSHELPHAVLQYQSYPICLDGLTNHTSSPSAYIQSPLLNFSRKHLLPIEHLQTTANPALFSLLTLSSKVRKFRTHTKLSTNHPSCCFHRPEFSQFCTPHVCCKSRNFQFNLPGAV